VLTVRVSPRGRVMPRAVLATVEIMVAVVAAHTWAGGGPPSVAWTAGAAALVLGAGVVVLRGRVSLPVAVPALVAAQLLLHCWMTVLAAGPHDHHGGAPLGLDRPMLVAHVVGGLVTALVWAVRRRAVDVLVAWSDPGLLPAPMLPRALSLVAPVLPLRRPTDVVPLRGPPVAVA